MVGQHVGAQAGDPAVTGSRQLGGHMIVAREGRGREVLHAVLYPLHRHTQHDRADDGADVAWIDADLVAEAAADVRRDRSEEHTSELQSLMRISYAVFCLK